MEPIDPRSLAIARLHMQKALRQDGDTVALHWGSVEPHQAMLTEALTFLGFDVGTGSEDFEVPPAEMPDVAELLVLTNTGIQKLNRLFSGLLLLCPACLHRCRNARPSFRG
jgi:hypothetical protein